MVNIKKGKNLFCSVIGKVYAQKSFVSKCFSFILCFALLSMGVSITTYADGEAIVFAGDTTNTALNVVRVLPGTSIKFAAKDENGRKTGVTWSLDSTGSSFTVNSAGVVTAPDAVDTAEGADNDVVVAATWEGSSVDGDPAVTVEVVNSLVDSDGYQVTTEDGHINEKGQLYLVDQDSATLQLVDTNKNVVDEVAWLTSDSTIATIDEYGTLTRVKDGTVLVSGYGNENTAWLEVTFKTTDAGPQPEEDPKPEETPKPEEDSDNKAVKTGDNYSVITFFALSTLVAGLFLEFCLKYRKKECNN